MCPATLIALLFKLSNSAKELQVVSQYLGYKPHNSRLQYLVSIISKNAQTPKLSMHMKNDHCSSIDIGKGRKRNLKLFEITNLGVIAHAQVTDTGLIPEKSQG